MEFLRFGSSIPGAYWGCCAVCIIQNFKFDPDQKSSIELVDGDGGCPILRGGKSQFAGPTYLDIFKQRLRIGTFSSMDMPNHVFLAVLTQEQISGGHGKKWLKILKEHGFEFLRTTDNSVYTGDKLKGEGYGTSSHPNYIFGLFRNIGEGAIEDPYTPPEEWTDLDPVVPEPYTFIVGNADTVLYNESVQSQQLKLWNDLGPAKFLTEEEVVAAGAPVIMAGRRSQWPQQPKETRQKVEKETGTTAIGYDPFDEEYYEDDEDYG